MRLRHRLATVALATLGALAACDDATDPRTPTRAPVTVSGTLTPEQQAIVAGMSVEVTGSGITTPIIRTLTVSGATVNGTVDVPVGAARVFTVRAFDAQGTETYSGSATATVVAGTNPPLSVRLLANPGSVPIDVTIGTYAVTLSPPTASVAVNGEVTLTAAVTASTGTTPTGALTWGVLNPALVTLTVAADGRSATVRGKVEGATRVVASFEGVAAATSLTITAAATTNQPPVARANGPYTGTAGSAIAFSSSGSSDPDGTIAAYAWSFGDGTTSTQANPSRTYAQAGTYTATLTVTDDRGATGTSSATVTVSAPPTGSLAVSQLAAGLDFTCGLSAGAAFCWGANASGQLGNGTTTPSARPVAVTMPSGVTFTRIQSGALHTCGFTSAGAAYCWGGNAYGQLGLGDTATRTVPTAVPANVVPGSIGYYAACNSSGSGGANQCWGRSGASASYSLVPVVRTMPPGAQTYAVTAGAYQTCAYTVFPATGPSQQQKQIDCSGISGSVTINAGVALGTLWVADGYACNTYASQGGMQCWGSNAYGQWGNSSSGGPVALSGYFPTAFGSTFTCGGGQCVGANGSGQLGNGTTTVASFGTPTTISGGSVSGIAVSQGGTHACGIRGGNAYCWGNNASGQLGDGTTTLRTVPTAVVSAAP